MQEMPEMQVQSLGQEVLLEEDLATHSSILAWRIPWADEPGGPQSLGVTESDMTEQLSMHSYILNVARIIFCWKSSIQL